MPNDTFFLLSDSLKIGDFVILKDQSFNIFLGVEGILNEDVCGLEDINSIHDAIFCVHLQRQYSASRELATFLQKHGNDPRSITDENELNYLKALEVRNTTTNSTFLDLSCLFLFSSIVSI